jgi:hypothetical protein
MTNPYPTTSTDIDIRVSANRVTTLLKEQRPAEALQLLDQIRAHESARPAVQEALDRYVVADASTELNALRVQQTVDPPTFVATLDRLHKAETQPPRVPDVELVVGRVTNGQHH